MTTIDGEAVSHFRLREFENRDGFCMVHASLLESLERTRADLCAQMGEDVWVIITDALRTQRDLDRYGGIAVDLKAVVARTRERVPQRELGGACRRHFDFVKDDYGDGHVHADNRVRAR